MSRAAFAAIAVAVVAATAPAAHATRACRELPNIAWSQPLGVDVSLLGLAEVSAESVSSVKGLYLQTLCGLEPDQIWDVVNHGRGATFALPSDIATSLDHATPYFPRVDYVYVRGGGPSREIVVILFANGYEGPLFKLDQPLAWTAEQTTMAASYWDLLPYEFMRTAARSLHDIALFKSCYDVVVDVSLLFGAFTVSIPTGTQMCNRTQANPLGSMLMPLDNVTRGADVWVHELGHYNNWTLTSALSVAIADEFGSISRRNTKVLGVPVPLLFEERYPQAKASCAVAGCTQKGGCACATHEQPFGYVSNYAACGEAISEDFADTMAIAVSATQGVWRNDHVVQSRVALDNYRGNICNADGTWDGDYDFNPARLYGRSGADASVIGQKLTWIRANYTFSMTDPEDADGDGIPWHYADGRGIGDCDDTNPTIGACAVGSCNNADDCNDGNTCTVDTCEAGVCQHRGLDADGDGYVSAACGGDDCDDANRFVNPGAIELCDGIDNDCKNGSDGSDAVDAHDFWYDADGDGYGAGTPTRACHAPGLVFHSRWVSVGGDCNDADPAFHPGATESCTVAIDYNCDGNTAYADKDGDGVPACQDCDDNDPYTHPGAVEICDGKDNNCDGRVDENNPGGGASCNTNMPGVCAGGHTQCAGGALACTPIIRPGQLAEVCDNLDNDCDGQVDNGVKTTFFRDADGDGFGDPNLSLAACSAPAGWVGNSMDCFDHNANARPGQTGWFDHDRGDGSFDYDCDGLQRPRYAAIAVADCQFDACHWSGGWQSLIATCGETHKWLSGCWGAAWICTEQQWDNRVQDCR